MSRHSSFECEIEFDILRPADSLAARRLLLRKDTIAYVSAAQKDAVKKRFPRQE